MPAEKQYLVTERVPCQARVNDLEKKGDQVHELLLPGDDEWTELKTEQTGQEAVDIDAAMDDKEEVKQDDDDQSEEEIDIDAQLA